MTTLQINILKVTGLKSYSNEDIANHGSGKTCLDNTYYVQV
jgi:hypothetical protein